MQRLISETITREYDKDGKVIKEIINREYDKPYLFYPPYVPTTPCEPYASPFVYHQWVAPDTSNIRVTL